MLKRIRSLRQLNYLKSPDTLRAGHTLSRKAINAAQTLHAAVYLKRGYVNIGHLGGDGRLHEEFDPYQLHSEYFTVTDHRAKQPQVVATARQINVRAGSGHDSFPTMKELEVYPEMKAIITKLDPDRCVEVSGLAKASGVSPTAVLMLYRSMWHHSLRRGHYVWLIACDAKAYERLKYLFGDAIIRIGDNAFYMGSEVVPAMVEVDRSVDAILRETKTLNPFKRKMKRELVNFFMEGLPLKYRRVKKPKSKLVSKPVKAAAK